MYSSTTKNENIIVIANKAYAHNLSYVEYIQNFLGVHEYYGHQVLGYGDKKNNHHKVYQLQMKHPTFKSLNPADQQFVIDKRDEYIRKEIGR